MLYKKMAHSRSKFPKITGDVQWPGGSKFSRGASVKFGAPKSNLDACAPPPPKKGKK